VIDPPTEKLPRARDLTQITTIGIQLQGLHEASFRLANHASSESVLQNKSSKRVCPTDFFTSAVEPYCPGSAVPEASEEYLFKFLLAALNSGIDRKIFPNRP